MSKLTAAQVKLKTPLHYIKKALAPQKGHVGGVAVVKKDGYTYAFIPSGSGLYRYDLEVPEGGDSSHIQKIIPTSAPKINA